MTVWFLIVGFLLILMGLIGSVLERLPLSPAMLYLAIGFALGPSGVGLVNLEPKVNAEVLTILSEIAVLISLFTVGLKMRVPLSDRLWRLPVRLGILTMLVTIGLLTLAGTYALDLPLGAAILMSALLAPTDPVLASDVQIKDVGDRDRIRFSLSGEGGLNDGTTYPFMMLGLFLLGVEEVGDYGSIRAVLRVLWAIVAGLGGGWLMGRMVVGLVLHVRKNYREAVGMEEFLTLGLIALSYGVASIVGGIGFLATFAAGVAMRRAEHKASGDTEPEQIIGTVPVHAAGEAAIDPQKAPAYMAQTVLGFNQQLEHIAEFAMVLLLGVILSGTGISREGLLVACLLIFVIRPVSVLSMLAGTGLNRTQRRMMAWFGIRGIGTLYWLMYALQYDWHPDLSRRLVSLTLTVVAVSVLVHGISATPLMDAYYRRKQT
ncbi:cation:proton antiporter [Noviherbaspirillum massiliense]|uniref:cation:proton antiporter n=1 Tax=Noviherbaspirillum massiliense TaxID=1465823 RepID=UPI0003196799|nr:cation:proton antiporter [Noviherbaspirillum massiliense]